VRDNRLESLPDFGALRSVRELDLRGNVLRTLPEWMLQLPDLEKLDLRWNPLDVPAWIYQLEEQGCTVYV